MWALSIESQMKMHIVVGIKKVLRFDSQLHLSVNTWSDGKVTVPALYSMLMLVIFAVSCLLLSHIYSHCILLHSSYAVMLEDLPISFGLNIYLRLFSKHVNHCSVICLMFLFWTHIITNRHGPAVFFKDVLIH